jgi:hypothetical protein
MPEINYIQKSQRTKTHPGKEAWAAVVMSGIFMGATLLMYKILKSFQPKTNPFADSNGRPRKGYRKQFYEFELQKKQRYLNSLPEEERGEIIAGQQAFFERMQS